MLKEAGKLGVLIGAFFMLILFVSFASAESYSVTNYNSTLAIVSVSGAQDMYSYEVNFDYSGGAGTYSIQDPGSHANFLGDGATYGDNFRGGIISVYGSKLDNSGSGASGSGPLFNISHSGTLSFRTIILVHSNLTAAVTSYVNPIIRLDSHVYACENSFLSKTITIESFGTDPIAVSTSPSSSFFADPSSISVLGNSSVLLFSSSFSRADVGDHPFSISAVSAHVSASASSTLTVIPVNNIPVITTIAAQTATAGGSFAKQVQATDLEDGGNLVFSLNMVPSAPLTINESGYISSTGALALGSIAVYVTVEDHGLNIVHPNSSLCGGTGPKQATTSFTLAVGNGGGGGGGSGTAGSSSAGNRGSSSSGVSGASANTISSILGLGNSTLCLSSYICSDWGECKNGVQEKVCGDKLCGRPVYSQTRPCSLTCQSNYSCGNWDSCTYIGKTADVLKGQLSLTGYQSRECKDSNGCVGVYTEEQFCQDLNTVQFTKTVSCGQDVIEAIDPITKYPVAIVNMNEWKSKVLSISLLQGDRVFCASCYNGVQDSDEQGIDCGGNCKPCKTQFNWLIIVALLSWVLFLIVGTEWFIHSPRRISAKILSLTRKGRALATYGKYPLAREKYNEAQKLYRGLDVEYHQVVDREMNHLKAEIDKKG